MKVSLIKAVDSLLLMQNRGPSPGHTLGFSRIDGAGKPTFDYPATKSHHPQSRPRCLPCPYPFA